MNRTGGARAPVLGGPAAGQYLYFAYPVDQWPQTQAYPMGNGYGAVYFKAAWPTPGIAGRVVGYLFREYEYAHSSPETMQ